MGGKPCIRGMRMTVYDVLDYLASGMTDDEIPHTFRTSHVRTCAPAWLLPLIARGGSRACQAALYPQISALYADHSGSRPRRMAAITLGLRLPCIRAITSTGVSSGA